MRAASRALPAGGCAASPPRPAPPGAAEAPRCVAPPEAGAGSLCCSAPLRTRWAARTAQLRTPPPGALPAAASPGRPPLGLAGHWRVAGRWSPGRCGRPCALALRPPPRAAGRPAAPPPPPRAQQRARRPRPGPEMSFFGFGQSVEVDIVLNDAESRKRAEHKTEDGKKEKYFLFYDGETVSGKVSLALKNPNKRLEHQGIKIEFIGQIELYYDRGNHHEFVSLVKDLARPGEISQSQAFDFEFTHVEKPYESYTGQNVKLRYFLRATISRRLNDVVKEMDIVVHTLSTYPELNSSIKMEVGIEDCLHIEFEYNKSKYHLKDVIVGKIYFLLVRIKIKHMEIDIIKRETTGTGPNVYHENDTIAKYEIMDGAPVRGESIPIRLFLAGYELTPTMRDINKKFSVRYYLNLVLIDEEERRYFKQQEVVLWRKGDIVRKSMSHQAAIASQRFEGTTSLAEARTPSQLSDNNSRQ
ncbi:Vacuolar protein sorting-associated protein 26B [Vulpes lagopus]|uniref:vacuolar protein sorting-associated protein 26B n=1 Tax=Vulpes lagopus TaxID=494514 RepID=UPI001BC979C8|nr:vacuolar protein sorting-associated protein 26B [Vulpes lagopus]